MGKKFLNKTKININTFDYVKHTKFCLPKDVREQISQKLKEYVCKIYNWQKIRIYKEFPHIEKKNTNNSI